MDGSRFDTLARSLSTAGSRRRALGGLLAGTLGILGWHDGDRSAAHDLKATCKKKSGEAKKKCLKKAKKHAAQHANETPPALVCTPTCSGKQCGSDGCSGSCGSCGALSCRADGTCDCTAQANGTSCGGGRTCSGGVCGTAPTCKRAVASCTSPGECCSGLCGGANGNCSCNLQAGDPCYDDTDCTNCLSASARCVGFVCRV